MTLDQAPDVMTVKQVTEILQADIKTTYALIRDGILPSIRLGERGIRVTKVALCRFLQLDESESDEPYLRAVT